MFSGTAGPGAGLVQVSYVLAGQRLADGCNGLLLKQHPQCRELRRLPRYSQAASFPNIVPVQAQLLKPGEARQTLGDRLRPLVAQFIFPAVKGA